MFICSLGIAAGMILIGTAVSQASVPSVDDQVGFHSELTIAATPGDVGDPILVARRGADDRSGDDRHDDKGKSDKGKSDKHKGDKHKDGKREKEKHKGGKDDGPGHV